QGNILENDNLGGRSTGELSIHLINESNAYLSLNQDGSFIYFNDDRNAIIDSFKYEVCSSDSNICDTAIVYIEAFEERDMIDPKINCPSNSVIQSIDEIPNRFSLKEFINSGGRINDNCDIDLSSFGLISEYL